jgi:hypothetical protein
MNPQVIAEISWASWIGFTPLVRAMDLPSPDSQHNSPAHASIGSGAHRFRGALDRKHAIHTWA